MSADLSAALTIARAVLRDFNGALSALTDDDLTTYVRSTTWEAGGRNPSPTPRAPYLADAGLRGEVMAGAVACHLAAVALCALDCVDDPLPWEEPPVPDRRSMPSLAEIRLHLAHLDTSLAQVQAAHLPAHGDREQALTACLLLIDSDALTYQPKHPEDKPPPPRRTRGRWTSLAATTSPTCLRCGGLDTKRVDGARVPTAVHGRICAACRAKAVSDGEHCRNPLGRTECRDTIVSYPKAGLCSSCYQAEQDLKRGKAPRVEARLRDMLTTTCTDCGSGCTVPVGETPRCGDCLVAA